MTVDIRELFEKICIIEKELEEVKRMLNADPETNERKCVSLAGLGSLLIPEDELDEAIIEAKRSIINGAGHGLCH